MAPRLCLVVAAIAAQLLSLSRASAAVTLTEIGTFTAPVAMANAGDERLFVVEQAGRIRIHDTNTGITRPTAFLDIASKVSSGDERGLLGLAFHPDYASNGFFYVNYTNLAGNTVIERYTVSADRNVANGASGVTLMVIAQPFSNHNGGQIAVRPSDGYLYIGMGDGGSGGDPFCNAQTRGTLLGKMLRIDVRQNLHTPPYYGIPASNPFRAANDPGNEIPDEIWAFGLRNPWRFSFDRQTSDLYIGDVGQEGWEEIDLHRATQPGGQNFGWKVMEGAHCYSAGSCPAYAPACNAPQLTLPIHEFPHENGDCSVIGGYLYRGVRAAPELGGRYLFSDYCSGWIRSLTQTSPGVFEAQNLTRVTTGDPTTFGEASNGELYLAAGNRVYRIGSTIAPPNVPALPWPALAALAVGLLAAGRRRDALARAPR